MNSQLPCQLPWEAPKQDGRISPVTVLTCHHQSLGLQPPLCHYCWPSSQGHLGTVHASLQAPWAAAGRAGTHCKHSTGICWVVGTSSQTTCTCLGQLVCRAGESSVRYRLAVVAVSCPGFRKHLSCPKACHSGTTLDRCLWDLNSLGLWRPLQPMQQPLQEALEAAPPPAGQLAPLADASGDSPASPCCQAPGQRCHLQQQQVG